MKHRPRTHTEAVPPLRHKKPSAAHAPAEGVGVPTLTGARQPPASTRRHGVFLRC